MYEMVDKEYIRKRHFMDGWSIREISRTLKISRQTVRKMLNDTEVPKYQLKAAHPCPVMDRWSVNMVNAELIESHITKADKPYTAGAVPVELQKYRLSKQNPARYDELARRVVH